MPIGIEFVGAKGALVGTGTRICGPTGVGCPRQEGGGAAPRPRPGLRIGQRVARPGLGPRLVQILRAGLAPAPTQGRLGPATLATAQQRLQQAQAAAQAARTTVAASAPAPVATAPASAPAAATAPAVSTASADVLSPGPAGAAPEAFFPSAPSAPGPSAPFVGGGGGGGGGGTPDLLTPGEEVDLTPEGGAPAVAKAGLFSPKLLLVGAAVGAAIWAYSAYSKKRKKGAK